MNASIQYVRTADGVRIAYAEIAGRDPPILVMYGIPFAHTAATLARPTLLLERLAEQRRLVMFDPRGCGLSDHDAADLTPEAFALDIDAVSQQVGADRFAFLAMGDSCPSALHYAATRPDSVTRLALWLAICRSNEHGGVTAASTMRMLALNDWDTFLRTVAHAVIGNWEPQGAQAATDFVERTSSGLTRDRAIRLFTALEGHDATPELGSVLAPTLAMTRERVLFFTPERARAVAAGVPNGALRVFPGGAAATDSQVVDAVLDFSGKDFGAQGAPAKLRIVESEPDDGLSAREMEVLRLIRLGRSNQQIADELVISLNTVTTHVRHIFEKTGVSNRTEAAMYASKRGMG